MASGIAKWKWMVLVALAVQPGAVTIFPADPAVQRTPQPGFARMERWACPVENARAFRDYVTTVWVPLFDTMVEEGLFTSWSSMDPVETRDVDFEGDPPAVEEVAEPWSWTGVWQGESREVFEASWREYHRRLTAARPDLPGPEGLCVRVRVSTYTLER